MSEEEQTSDGELLTAEYKDGKLEIVEMASYSKGNTVSDMTSDGPGFKYVQVLDSKDTVVDLLNFTLVRSDNGQQSYRLVSSGSVGAGDDATVTCVLASGDPDDAAGDEGQDQEQYVMVEGIEDNEDGSMVYLKTEASDPDEPEDVQPIVRKNGLKAAFKTPSSPTEILEKAKALQKAKILMRCTQPRTSVAVRKVPARRGAGGRGGAGGRRSELPPTHELLASPNFKLFLYNCKMCRFKCNAIKELTAHKALEHGTGTGSSGGGSGGRWRGAGRSPAGSMQCARCPFRAATHTQLMKHVTENHSETVTTKVYLDSEEVVSADVLVCGACGFESGARDAFREHIREQHGAAC